MALDKPTLKTGIKTLIQDLFNNSATMTPADAQEQFADTLTNLIDAFVKSGDGIYQTGKLTSPSGPVTAVGSPAIKIQ